MRDKNTKILDQDWETSKQLTTQPTEKQKPLRFQNHLDMTWWGVCVACMTYSPVMGHKIDAS